MFSASRCQDTPFDAPSLQKSTRTFGGRRRPKWCLARTERVAAEKVENGGGLCGAGWPWRTSPKLQVCLCVSAANAGNVSRQFLALPNFGEINTPSAYFVGVTMPTLSTPLHAMYTRPSAVAAMLRTTPPPEGIFARAKVCVFGSN